MKLGENMLETSTSMFARSRCWPANPNVWRWVVSCISVLQAAVWHCLNHYAYPDAIFLAERLYAEGEFDWLGLGRAILYVARSNLIGLVLR